MLLEYLFLFLIIGIVWYWWDCRCIKREKQKFSDFKEKYASIERDNRNDAVIKCQKDNMKELAEIVYKLLNTHERDLPPNLFDETKDAIRSYVKEINFDKLYTLYNILRESNSSNVYDQLKIFGR